MNDVQPKVEQTEVEAEIGIETDQKVVEARLLYTLNIYPQISPSMLQIAMNPLRADAWRPTLERLISQGLIQRSHLSSISVVGHSITHTIIRAVDPRAVLDSIANRILEQSREAVVATTTTTPVNGLPQA